MLATRQNHKELISLNLFFGQPLRENNPSLNLPLMDEQAIEVALFLTLAARVGSTKIHAWLAEMVDRYCFTINGHGQYPTVFREYRDLIAHPKARNEEYREQATKGSVLIPLLAAWLSGFGDQDRLTNLLSLTAGALRHCTLQWWMPDEDSEKHFYINDATHGVVLPELQLSEDGAELVAVLKTAMEKCDMMATLSACRSGYFPVFLTGCRHYRLPLPPLFSISAAMLEPSQVPS